jgi:hypothetical protein
MRHLPISTSLLSSQNKKWFAFRKIEFTWFLVTQEQFVPVVQRCSDRIPVSSPPFRFAAGLACRRPALATFSTGIMRYNGQACAYSKLLGNNAEGNEPHFIIQKYSCWISYGNTKLLHYDFRDIWEEYLEGKSLSSSHKLGPNGFSFYLPEAVGFVSLVIRPAIDIILDARVDPTGLILLVLRCF